MTPGHRTDARRNLLLAGTLALCAVLCGPSFGSTAETDKNAFLYVIPREILVFSAQVGQWASVRLDPGERIFHRGADGNVAAVVTSKRAIGFSAQMGKWTAIERFQLGP